MTKLVYNYCFGGFGLSDKARQRMKLLGSQFEFDWDIPRHDPILVQVVEELGTDANGTCSDLRIAEIDEPCYQIYEYDGAERVETPNSIGWIHV
jgi:hypothetical protein